MNRNEFKKEIQQAYPEKIKEYEKFCYYQDIVADTLKIFVDICNKNSIPYQLAYGSLLGAVRDEGQIPWDYDIDVFVPYTYRKKLVDALNSLPSDYYFEGIESNVKYSSYIMRVAPIAFDSEFLHVDIFFLVGSVKDEVKRREHTKKIIELYLNRYYKFVHVLKQTGWHFRSFIKLFWKKLQYRHVDLNINDRLFFKELSRYEKDKEVYITGDRFADYYVFPLTIIDTIEIGGFDMKLSVPKKYDAILEEIYGDYMTIASLEERIAEFQKHLHALERNL